MLGKLDWERKDLGNEIELEMDYEVVRRRPPLKLLTWLKIRMLTIMKKARPKVHLAFYLVPSTKDGKSLRSFLISCFTFPSPPSWQVFSERIHYFYQWKSHCSLPSFVGIRSWVMLKNTSWSKLKWTQQQDWAHASCKPAPPASDLVTFWTYKDALPNHSFSLRWVSHCAFNQCFAPA